MLLSSVGSTLPRRSNRSAGSSSADASSDRIILRAHRHLAFTMAYQPVVDVVNNTVIGYEALVRGLHNEPASAVLGANIGMTGERRFDQRCHHLAIQLASDLGLLETGASLFLNFRPVAGEPMAERLAAALEAAEQSGFPLSRLVVEITESEPLDDPEAVQRVLTHYRTRGLRSAIDDFGAGFSGLSLLAVFQPDLVKIDIQLIRQINARRRSEIIVRSMVRMCADLNIQVIAEGVEQRREFETLQSLGVQFMQGNFFAEPGFERLPTWPAAPAAQPARRATDRISLVS